MTRRPLRLAMWSGPRNISTAMMRSFENRSDAIVIDEPFYAHWLAVTGTDHPGADEVLAVHETDPRKVVQTLLAPLPEGVSLFYQKQMAHHLLDDIDRAWIHEVENVFLIREPEEMLTSLMKVRPEPTLLETGLLQQLELFQELKRSRGRFPLVLDARDVLEDPRRMLRSLCEELDIPFEEAMLSWPAGRRDTDGVWAKHWYAAVEKSRGFQPWTRKSETVSPAFRNLLRDCRSIYEDLHRHRVQPA